MKSTPGGADGAAIETEDAPDVPAPNPQFPSSVLLRFFREATARLDGRPPLGDAPSLAADGGGDGAVPPSLEAQRQRLLRVQLDALERSVGGGGNDLAGDDDDVDVDVDVDGSGAAALADARAVLRQVGSRDFRRVAAADREEIVGAMAAMDDAARAAFARSVLRAELGWEGSVRERGGADGADRDRLRSERRLRGAADGGEMDRGAVVEFCGLCNAAVCLPEVRAFLRHGKFTDVSLSEDSERQDVAAESERDGGVDSGAATPQDRLDRLQKIMLRAVGYEPDFGKSEIHRLFFSKDECNACDKVDDSELSETFANFLSNMSVAVTNATLASACLDSSSDVKLSDCDKGGVTRVISVKYSEKFVDGSGEETTSISGAPSQTLMEEHIEAEQRKQLTVAREAAALQEAMVGELLSMDKAERETMLTKAREAHDSFLRRALAIPAEQERVAFLQSVDSEEQRLLAMHKLWERMLAENGGKEPTIHRSG